MRPVSVKINVHPLLTHLTDNQHVVEVKGNTVGQCLDQLVTRYPGLREWVFDKKGKLSKTFDIYLNMESTYPEELAKPVKDGDEIHLVMIISGG